MKKILSFILALSMIPVTAFAQNTSYKVETAIVSEDAEELGYVQFKMYPSKVISNPAEGESADYPITVKATGSSGNDFTDKVSVDWSVYGLENQEGNITFTSDGTSANLNVTHGAKDYFGYVAATVSYNGKVKVITTPFAIIASTESSYIIPKAGYPMDMKDYPDSLVGYEVKVRGLNNPDMIMGNSYYGSNGYMTAKLVDTEDGIRALELARNGGKGSSVMLYDWTPITDNYVMEFIAKGNLNAMCMNNRSSAVNYQWSISTDNNVLTVGNQTIEDVEISPDKWYKYIVTVNPAEYTFTVHTSEMTDEGYVTVSQVTANAQGGYDCRNVLFSTADTMYLKSFKAYLQGDEIVMSPEPIESQYLYDAEFEQELNKKITVPADGESEDYPIAISAVGNLGGDLKDVTEVEWKVVGLENQEGNITFTSDGTRANLNVAHGAKDYFGYVAATVSYNGASKTLITPFAVIASTETDYMLPEAGYPIEISDYPDSLVGYQASSGYSADIILGWDNSYSSKQTLTLVDNGDGTKAMEFAANEGTLPVQIKKSFEGIAEEYPYPTYEPEEQQGLIKPYRINFTAKIPTDMTVSYGYSTYNDWIFSVKDGKLTVGDKTINHIRPDEWYNFQVWVVPWNETYTLSLINEDGYTVGKLENIALENTGAKYITFSTSDKLYIKEFSAIGLPEGDIMYDGGMELVPPVKTTYVEAEILDLTGLEAYDISGELYNGVYINTVKSPASILGVDLENIPLTVDNRYVTVTVRNGFAGFEQKMQFAITVLPSSEATPSPELQYAVTFDEYLRPTVYTDETMTQTVETPYTVTAGGKLYFDVEVPIGGGDMTLLTNNGVLEKIDFGRYVLSDVTGDVSITYEIDTEPYMSIKLSKNEAGSIVADVWTSHAGTAPPEGIKAVAAYTDDGRMYAIRMTEAITWKHTFEFEVLPEDVKTFKAMWWDGTDTMKPYISSETAISE